MPEYTYSSPEATPAQWMNQYPTRVPQLVELDPNVAILQSTADEAAQAAAFESLARTYGSVIRSKVEHTIFRVGNTVVPEDADEATQEALTRIWRNIDYYRPTDPFGSWVVEVAGNVTKNYNMSTQRWRPERVDSEAVNRHIEFRSREADHALPTPEEHVAPTLGEYDHLRRHLQVAIKLVKPKFREVLEMHLLGYANEQIAEKLGIPYATVGTRLHRARTQLKDILL